MVLFMFLPNKLSSAAQTRSRVLSFQFYWLNATFVSA